MTANKHTPGPWRYEGAEVWATAPMRFNLTTAGTPMIATLCRHEDAEGGFPVEANARLIAAAPELLEALTGLVAAYEALGEAVGRDGSWHSHALAAISKATGGAA